MKLLSPPIRILIVVGFVFMTVTAIISVVSAAAIVSRQSTPTIDFELVGAGPASPVCAGETITLANHIRVSRTPALVAIYESWWSEDLGYNVVLGDHVRYSVVTTPEDFTRVFSIEVPGLSPGRYQYRRLAQDDGAPVAAISINVLVKECQ